MRNPADPEWPDAGERTELQEIAERWKWACLDRVRAEHRERVLGKKKPRTLGEQVDVPGAPA